MQRSFNVTDVAVDYPSGSVVVGERNPTNFVVVTPEYLVNNTAVTADPGPSYAPGANGIQMLGFKDISFQLYLIGGTTGGPVNRTVTVTFEAYNGLDVAAAARWVDITPAGYDATTDTTGNANYTGVGSTVSEYMIDFDNLNYQAIRVLYDWDGAPDNTDGAIVITARRKAL